MALEQTLLSFTSSAPATKNRVEILLDRLAGTEDFPVLSAALRNPAAIRGAALTKALRKEYGDDVVKDFSVDDWRRKNLAEVTGL
jgi:hypothetical protein